MPKYRNKQFIFVIYNVHIITKHTHLFVAQQNAIPARNITYLNRYYISVYFQIIQNNLIPKLYIYLIHVLLKTNITNIKHTRPLQN